jgi:hypothetical protein
MTRLILGLLYPTGAVRTTKYEKRNLVLIPEKRAARAVVLGMHHVSRSAVYLARSSSFRKFVVVLLEPGRCQLWHLRPGQGL